MAQGPAVINAVYLIDSLEGGGAQRQLVELVKGLDRRHFNPRVVIYHDNRHFVPELERAGIPVCVLPKVDKPGLLFMASFLALLRRHRIDLVHSYLNIPNFYARMVKLCRPKTMVVTSERNVSILHSRVHTVLERLTWRLSDLIIVNAETIRTILVGDIGVAPEKIRVINNGIDLKVFSQSYPAESRAMREQVMLGTGGCLISLIGRLCPQKGQIHAVEAAGELVRANPGLNFKICLWGKEDDTAYVSRLRQSVVSLGLADRIVFGGVQANVPAVLQATDLLILPSLWEGFPNVLLEATASRIPVIATDIVDNRQIIDDGTTGILIKPGDSRALAQGISRYFAMPAADVQVMTDRAYQSTVSRYSVDVMVRSTCGAYADIGVMRGGNA